MKHARGALHARYTHVHVCISAPVPRPRPPAWVRGRVCY